ncbi:MAG: hypothetical protein ABJE95_26845 [Byssovorax sp.]
MNPAPASPGSVEHFAEIVAQLSAPFAVREAVLRAAGLDDRAWIQREDLWIARLEADPALVDRYVVHYRAVEQGRVPVDIAPIAPVSVIAPTPTPAPTPEPAPSASQPEPPPLVAEPIAAWRIDGTLEPDAGAALRASLPFLKSRPAAHITTPSPVAPPADPRRPDATLELGASLPLPSLRISPEIATPGKRLHRFDSKTGAPLPVPVWIDDPTDPKKPA